MRDVQSLVMVLIIPEEQVVGSTDVVAVQDVMVGQVLAVH